MQNSGPTGELLSRVLKNLRRTTDDLCTVTPRIGDRFLLTDVTSQIEKYSEMFAEPVQDMDLDNGGMAVIFMM